jgi:predicted transcriptional regulator
MEKLVKQLMDAGVVQRNDAAENKPVTVTPENSSPNFK